MLSNDAKEKLLPLLEQMQEIIKQDNFIYKRYGACMLCGKDGKETSPMGYSHNLTFAETGMENPILCKNHQIGWTRSSNAKIDWYKNGRLNKPSSEEVQTQFALWLLRHFTQTARSTEETNEIRTS
jgi:hypothetical protein